MAYSPVSITRQLPEDEHPYMERDMKIGELAGHELILRVHQDMFDYGVCSCGKWESIKYRDDRSAPYPGWKQHAQHKGVSFGSQKVKAKSPQH